MCYLGEWISGAVCMYIANYLCENYGKDQQVGFHVCHPVCTCDL